MGPGTCRGRPYSIGWHRATTCVHARRLFSLALSARAHAKRDLVSPVEMPRRLSRCCRSAGPSNDPYVHTPYNGGSNSKVARLTCSGAAAAHFLRPTHGGWEAVLIVSGTSTVDARIAAYGKYRGGDYSVQWVVMVVPGQKPIP